MSEIRYLGSSINYEKNNEKYSDTIKCNVLSTNGPSGSHLIKDKSDFDKYFSTMEYNDNWNLIKELSSLGYRLLVTRHMPWVDSNKETVYSTKSEKIYTATLTVRDFFEGDYISLDEFDRKIIFSIEGGSDKYSPLFTSGSPCLTVPNADFDFLVEEIINFYAGFNIIIKEEKKVFTFSSKKNFFIDYGNCTTEKTRCSLRMFDEDLKIPFSGEVVSITDENITLKDQNGTLRINTFPKINNLVVTVEVGDYLETNDIYAKKIIACYPDVNKEYEKLSISGVVPEVEELDNSTYTFASELKLKDDISLSVDEFVLVNRGYVNNLIVLVNNSKDTEFQPILYDLNDLGKVVEVRDDIITILSQNKVLTYKAYSPLQIAKVAKNDIVRLNDVLFDLRISISNSSYNSKRYIGTGIKETPVRSDYDGEVKTHVNDTIEIWRDKNIWEDLDIPKYSRTFTYKKGEEVLFDIDGVFYLFSSTTDNNKNNTPEIGSIYWKLEEVDVYDRDVTSYPSQKRLLFYFLDKSCIAIKNKKTTSEPPTVLYKNEESFEEVYFKKGDYIKRGDTIFFYKKTIVDSLLISSLISEFKNMGFSTEYDKLNYSLKLKKNVRFKLLKISSFEIENWKNGSYDVICSNYDDDKIVDFYSSDYSSIPNLRIEIRENKRFFTGSEKGYDIDIFKTNYKNEVTNSESFLVSLDSESEYFLEKRLRQSEMIRGKVYKKSFLPTGSFNLGRSVGYQVTKEQMIANLKNSNEDDTEFNIVIDSFIKHKEYQDEIYNSFKDRECLILNSIDYEIIDEKIVYNNFDKKSYDKKYNICFSYPDFYYGEKKYPCYFAFLKKMIEENDVSGEVTFLEKIDTQIKSEYSQQIMNITYDKYRYVLSHNMIKDNLKNQKTGIKGGYTVPEIIVYISRFKNFVYNSMDFSKYSEDYIEREFKKYANKMAEISYVLSGYSIENIVIDGDTCDFTVILEFDLLGIDPVELSLTIEKIK